MDNVSAGLSSKTSFLSCSTDDFYSITNDTEISSHSFQSSSASKSNKDDNGIKDKTSKFTSKLKRSAVFEVAIEPDNTIQRKANMDSLLRLKDSTRTLLSLLEDIESKTHNMKNGNSAQKMYSSLKPLPTDTIGTFSTSPSQIINLVNMKSLQQKTKNLEEIYIKTEADDCSIFKRLTRQCHCLNNDKYNNFVIHFNEDTKYFTSTLGEVIKNIRILKKFLYMGNNYTNDALTFLVEGLTTCPHNERVEIAQACAHADICNVFDDHSIITFCIVYPLRKDKCGDAQIQNLSAKLLFTLSQLEEGRRYLNFSSRIINDIKRVVSKNEKRLSDVALEYLNLTMNLLNPSLTKHINVTYYCKAEQGIGYRTLTALTKYHMHMTTEEISTNLDLLQNLCEHKGGKRELIQNLSSILTAFKLLIVKYDDSDINSTITNILNNLLKKNDVNIKESELIPTYTVCDTTTEPIAVRCALNQVPSERCNKKGKFKSTLHKLTTLNRKDGENIKGSASQKYDYNATMRKLNLSK